MTAKEIAKMTNKGATKTIDKKTANLANDQHAPVSYRPDIELT